LPAGHRSRYEDDDRRSGNGGRTGPSAHGIISTHRGVDQDHLTAVAMIETFKPNMEVINQQMAAAAQQKE